MDPDLAETGQPYAFTGDDPLNATDPLGLYKYKYTELIGSTKRFGSTKSVFKYFENNLKKVFPFKVTGASKIRNGSKLTLHPDPSAVGGVGNVTVSNVTSTSLKFTVTSTGYFDPPGSSDKFQHNRI